MQKYRKLVDSLIRALVHEGQPPGLVPAPQTASKDQLVEVATELFRFLGSINFSSLVRTSIRLSITLFSLIFPLLFLSIPLVAILFPHGFAFSGLSEIFYQLEVFLGLGLLSYLGFRLFIHYQRFRLRRQWAEDQVEALLTMANMPWNISRVVLPSKSVEYRLEIPFEDRDVFQGSPTLLFNPTAAEKADLLILAVKGDQKLLEKWNTRTLPA